MLPCFRIQEMQKVIYYVWIPLPFLPISNLDACFVGEGGSESLHGYAFKCLFSPHFLCVFLSSLLQQAPILLSSPQTQYLSALDRYLADALGRLTVRL